MLDSPKANAQTLCDSCQCPDALDVIRMTAQEAVSSDSLISRFFGKLAVLGKVGDLLRRMTDKTIHDLGGVDAVKALAGNLYDTYVGPIDIPWVPQFVESTVVDPFFKSMLLKVIDEVHDQVHGGS